MFREATNRNVDGHFYPLVPLQHLDLLWRITKVVVYIYITYGLCRWLLALTWQIEGIGWQHQSSIWNFSRDVLPQLAGWYIRGVGMCFVLRKIMLYLNSSSFFLFSKKDILVYISSKRVESILNVCNNVVKENTYPSHTFYMTNESCRTHDGRFLSWWDEILVTGLCSALH